MRAMFDVTGTMVITPRPKRAAVELAPSLLTMTAGRRLFASAPLTGSKSTRRISDRCISRETVADNRFPRFFLAGQFPLDECLLVGGTELGPPQKAHGLMQHGGSRCESLFARVSVKELDVLVWKADAELHTLMLPLVGL
jgi:hypothetical protein